MPCLPARHLVFIVSLKVCDSGWFIVRMSWWKSVIVCCIHFIYPTFRYLSLPPSLVNWLLLCWQNYYFLRFEFFMAVKIFLVLCCDTVSSSMCLSTFRRVVLPPPSGWSSGLWHHLQEIWRHKPEDTKGLPIITLYCNIICNFSDGTQSIFNLLKPALV
jgi:hypothetical protein